MKYRNELDTTELYAKLKRNKRQAQRIRLQASLTSLLNCFSV